MRPELMGWAKRLSSTSNWQQEETLAATKPFDIPRGCRPAAWWERCEPRGSRTVLSEAGGETPPAYSPHVLRFQEPRLRARRQPDQASRTARPPHPGHGVGAVLGGGDRHGGAPPPAHRRRKDPCHARPRSYARSLTS